MSIDFDNLPETPDVDAIDISTLDKGDTLEALEAALDPKDDPEVTKLADEINGKKDEPAPKDEESEEEKDEEEKAESKEEQPRDENGKFTSKEARIPKSRFDEQVGKERAAREAAERKLAEAERLLAEREKAEQKGAELSELEEKASALEVEYNKLMLDGEGEKAAEVMRQIRMTERQIVKMETVSETAQVTAQTLEAQRVDIAIAKLESEYPVMNPKSEEFNPKIVNYVLAEQARLMRSEGLSRSEALTRAGKEAMEELFSPKVEPKEAVEEKGLSKAAEERKEAQVRKNLEVSKSQPASMRDTGLDSDKLGQSKDLPDVTKMSQEEYNALPEATRARLRGDIL